MQASESDAAFAEELPAFVREVKDIFEPHEIRGYLDSVQRVSSTGHTMDDASYEFARDAGMFEESVVRAAEDVVRMGRIREMLVG